MATLRQAVERLRENGKLSQGGVVSFKDLNQVFRPVPAGSTRALLSAMFGSVSTNLPWAVILCRFKGAAANPAVEAPVEQFYGKLFSPGTGGLVEYWRDASLGTIDIAGSRVFPWVEVDIARSAAGIGSGENRSTLVDRAINAAKKRGEDPITGFHSQIAIYTENWAKDGAPAGADFSDPVWGPSWIDGSADGRGKVTLTPPHYVEDIAAHEMGHGFGMQHDVGPDFKTHYADPCCIMSQTPIFTNPVWKTNFGPAVCLPHLVQKDWMYKRRIFSDDGAWLSQPDGITLPLAPISDPGARGNLGLKLAYRNGDTSWDYYLEYAKPTEWNRGLSNAFLFIRRIGPTDVGPTPIILGKIIVPTAIGTKSQVVEPSGNVRFQVERLDPDGRIVKVNAKKL